MPQQKQWQQQVHVLNHTNSCSGSRVFKDLPWDAQITVAVQGSGKTKRTVFAIHPETGQEEELGWFRKDEVGVIPGLNKNRERFAPPPEWDL